MNPDYTKPNLNSDIRILIVDDEQRIRSTLVRALSLVGYSTEEAGSGEEALALLEMNPYDVIVLDLLMPDLSGEELMQHASQLQPDLMIIILTGNASLESAITAIKSEAVDYLLKPASMRDVIETVNRALQKRREQKKNFARAVSEVFDELKTSDSFSRDQRPPLPATRSVLVVPPLKLHRTNRSVTIQGKSEHAIELTKGETEVLACLMNHPNHPLSCRRIVREAWQYDVSKDEAESIIRPYISRLRHKIEDDPKAPTLIRTIRKRGYLFSYSG